MPSPTPFFAVMLCALACGCKPTTTPPAAPAAATVAPGSTAQAPATPGTAVIAYHCTDGRTFEATYGDHGASLRWPDGRSAQLPRAESASKGGGDVYVGETVSLQRDASRIQLHDGNAPPVTCNEAD
jgi:hypothetical protein